MGIHPRRNRTDYESTARTVRKSESGRNISCRTVSQTIARNSALIFRVTSRLCHPAEDKLSYFSEAEYLPEGHSAEDHSFGIPFNKSVRIVISGIIGHFLRVFL